jgi:hypothetical protein
MHVQIRSTSPDWVDNQFKEASGGKAPETVAKFISTMAMALIDNRSFNNEEWVVSLMMPYLTPHMGEPDAKAAGQAFVDSCRKEVRSLQLPHPAQLPESSTLEEGSRRLQGRAHGRSSHC